MALRQAVEPLVAALVAAGVAGCGSTVEVRPAAQAMAPSVTTVVGLPVTVGWGGDADQRRIQRRTSDRLLAATGGHAVIAEELGAGEDDQAVAATLSALGEDGARAVTFAVGISFGGRMVRDVSPLPGFNVGKRLVIDYRARVEVRRLGGREIIGSVETLVSSAPANSEFEPNGASRAVMEAIDGALAKAVAAFAPRLASDAPAPEIVEIPVEAAADVAQRLLALNELYPELDPEDARALMHGPERFLVLEPGPLASFGIARGDLLGIPGGRTTASRAALARMVARGAAPSLAVVRGGQRYLAWTGNVRGSVHGSVR